MQSNSRTEFIPFGEAVERNEFRSKHDICDPASDTWTTGPPLPEPRAGSGNPAAVARGRVGVGPKPLAAAEEADKAARHANRERLKV